MKLCWLCTLLASMAFIALPVPANEVTTQLTINVTILPNTENTEPVSTNMQYQTNNGFQYMQINTNQQCLEYYGCYILETRTY